MKTFELTHSLRVFKSACSAPAFIALGLLLAVPPESFAAGGDASRGRDVLRERGCVVCHPVAQDESGPAPNLGQIAARGLNPASFTALLWNHAPAMWEAMAARNMPIPQPSEQDVADLFAYFYSLRYFEPPGDAARGKRAFEAKRCVECHPLGKDASPVAGAPPVSQWPSIADPMIRLEAMWNHAARMSQEMQKRGIRWPRFRPQEMADLWVFLRARPNEMAGVPRGAFGDVAEGRQVFALHRCDQCHTLGERVARKIDLKAAADSERNFAAFAAAMWNHQPRLAEFAALEGAAVRRFEADEMAHLIAYLREQQLFWPAGDADQGAKTFRNKSCYRCHAEGSAQAPRLHGSLTPYTPERVASALWRHGPAMLRRMEDEGIAWRRLTGGELTDLIAYINTL